MWIWTHTYMHKHTVSCPFTQHLLQPAWLCMTAVQWDGKLLYYVCTPCNYTPTLSNTLKNTSGRGDVYHWNLVIIKRRDINFSSNGCCHYLVFISPSSDLHYLLPLPGLHIRILETNKHTHAHINAFHCFHWSGKSNCTESAKKRIIHIHTRPPSSHSAKPSACPSLTLRLFWVSAVMCFPPVMWVGVPLVFIRSPVSGGDRSWGRPSVWAVTNPLTTGLLWLALAIQMGMKSAGDRGDDCMLADRSHVEFSHCILQELLTKS